MDNLDVIKDFLKNIENTNKNKSDYILSYNKILNNTDITLDTQNIVNIFNDTINDCIKKDEIINNQLNNIDSIRTSISNKFIYKKQLCSEYITNYNNIKDNNNKLYKMYNNNINEIAQKNNEYNGMINDLLEQYNEKYNEYINSVNDNYPKNYIIQIIVNMVILTDIRNKSNVLFKNMMIEELTKQTTELNDHNKLNNNLNLNTMIMGECDNIEELISQIEKKNLINIKENVVENMINEL